MKTRAAELFKEIMDSTLVCAQLPSLLEAHLAAAYEQGRADERIAQNPPNVAQPWTVTAQVNFCKSWWSADRSRAVMGVLSEPVSPLERDARLKPMTEDQRMQLGRALACARGK